MLFGHKDTKKQAKDQRFMKKNVRNLKKLQTSIYLDQPVARHSGL